MHARNKQPAFTLIEVLMVVLIISILAALVIPQFQESATDAKDATLTHTLQVIRKAIERFRAQHHGKPPGWNGQIETAYWHLVYYSDAAGSVSYVPDAAYPYGPYLPDLPKNPITGGAIFKPSTNPAGETPNENLKISGLVVGWFYDKATGRIAANATGSTSSGVPRIQL